MLILNLLCHTTDILGSLLALLDGVDFDFFFVSGVKLGVRHKSFIGLIRFVRFTRYTILHILNTIFSLLQPSDRPVHFLINTLLLRRSICCLLFEGFFGFFVRILIFFLKLAFVALVTTTTCPWAVQCQLKICEIIYTLVPLA